MDGVGEEEAEERRGCKREEEEEGGEKGCGGEEVVVRPENISSTVVIKKADALMSPFSQLQQNADLNLPPPNWLRTNSPAVFFSQAQFTSERSKGDPSSVLLASHYPDYVGQVDVISDAKNIKKLLKMPYCPSGVSMAVHRVGNTLLIDELNAPHFFRGMSPLNLEKLFKEGELSELIFRKKDPAVSRHRNMFSKLLYYSVQDNPSRAMLPTLDSSCKDEERAMLPTPDSSCKDEERAMLRTPDSSANLCKDEERAMLPTPDSSANLCKDEERAMLPIPDSSANLCKDEERAMLPTPVSSGEVGNLCKDVQEEERGKFLTNSLLEEAGARCPVTHRAGEMRDLPRECSVDADQPGCVDVVIPTGRGRVGAISPAGQDGGGDHPRHEPLTEGEVGIEATSAAVEVGGSHVTTEPGKSDGLVGDPAKGDNEFLRCSRYVTDGGDHVGSTPSEGGTLPSPSHAPPKVSGVIQEEDSMSPSTEQKDEPRVSLALVPLTEAAHSFLTSITHTSPPPNLLTGDDNSPDELQSEVTSTATPSSVPAEELSEEHLSEGGGGVCGEGASVERSAGGVVLAGHGEEEHGEEQQATFPCLPPDPSPQPFNLNMQWSIKDIRMLLGSDLPIFGSEGHPAISLRLRDMQKPITVLTGLDYWLDNLMCNVPELAMCFHLNGIVQRYEVIKTEDIPSLLDKNCQFSAPEVLEVAQNILAFLRANCTKEGHTYWLFRRKGEDAVKLYDLTPLSRHKDDSSNGQKNSFAQSVAMLFYRVAQNLLGSSGESPSREDLTIVKLLLENCIRLLGDEKSQIVISAYYLLAQLFLSKTSSDSGSLSDHELEEEGEERAGEEREMEEEREWEEEKDNVSDYSREDEQTSSPSATTGMVVSAANLKSLPVSALRQGPKSFPADPSLPLPLLRLGSSQDRARAALEYISKALGKLNVLQLQSSAGVLWQATSGGHLLQLAGSAYFLLGDTTMGVGKLGRALRYTRYSIVCARASETLGTFPASDKTSILFRAWQLCGDIHCFSTKLSESFSSHLEDFQLENPEDTPLIAMATTLYHPDPGGKEDLCLTLHTDLEAALLRSIDSYNFAQAAPSLPSSPAGADQQQRSLCDRLGNSWNELGVYYMHVASSLNFASEPKQVEKLWTSSYSCLMEGLQRFQSAGNAPNQALLYSNLGSLMRSCAQAHGSALGEGNRAEFTLQEKLYYGKAAEFYIQGKQALRRRSAHPTIWGNLVSDLSAVYFTTGQLMQERAPLSTLTPQEVEREIVELLMKALHQTEPELAHVEPTSPSFISLSQRAGDCHYRLASLYQKSAFTASSSAQKQKHSRTQAEKHYSKALNFYMPRHHFRLVLRVLLEKALLYEQQAQSTGRPHVRNLQNALQCLLECLKPLREYPDHYEHELGSPSDPLLSVLVHRLQAVLKQLVAAAMKKSDATLTSYKAMYALVLRLPDSRDQPNHNLLPTLRETLTSVSAVQLQS